MSLPLVFQETDFLILDTNDGTVLRSAEQPEPTASNDPAGHDALGLRPGYSGAGYVDLNGGAEAKFSIVVPGAEIEPGTSYSLVMKVANGSTASRPVTILNGGTEVGTVADTRTGAWTQWRTETIEVALAETDANGDYVLTFVQTESQGPNFDAVALVPAGESYSFLDPVFEGEAEFDVMAGRTEIGRVLATDADGQDVGYAITGGADAALFAIDPETGTLSFLTAPVYDAAETGNAYAVEVTATDAAGASTTQTVAVSVAERFEPIYIQAESGTLTSTATGSRFLTQTNEATEGQNAIDAFGLRPGYSGEGYLDFGSTGDAVSYTVDLPEAGSYALHIRYAGTNTRTAQVRIDGEVAATVAFPDTTGDDGSQAFNNWAVQTVTIDLAEGANAIELFLHAGFGPNVDALAITALGDTPDFAPRFTAPGAFALDETTTEIGTVMATDVVEDTRGGGTPGPVSYAITGGADAELVRIDAVTGALSLLEAADFEAKDSYSIEVTAYDAVGNGTSQSVSVSVADIDEAPSVPLYAGASILASDIAAGTVLGTVTATDPEGAEISYTLSDPRFEIAGGQIFVAEGAVFATGEAIALTVTASDGTLSAQSEIALAVEAPVTPETPDIVRDVLFSEADLSSYAGTQDGGSDVVVSEDGAALSLNDNNWKRAALGEAYEITATSRLSVDIQIGANAPELVAVGFDLDNDPFDTDQSLYLLDGTDGQSRFLDLKGSGTDLGDGWVRYVIDLSAHAGKSIDTLVFVSDDDSASRDGLGSVTFSNVQLVEDGVAEPGNAAPAVIGGGLVDIDVDEGGAVEIDLPFVDPEGAALSYTFAVTDADGTDVTALFPDLAIDGAAITGTLPRRPGSYTVTVTADDGAEANAVTSDSFALTIADVNDAPVATDAALEPYFGAVDAAFEAIDVASFASYFTDPEGGELVLGIDPATLPAGLSFDPATGLITGTPVAGGSYDVVVTATDPGGLTARLTINLDIEGEAGPEVFTIEAEDFTGLDDAQNFYTAAAVGASGDQLIRTNVHRAGSVTTDLSAGGVPDGYYTLSITVYDETDGAARFSIYVDGATIVDEASFDDAGTWLNGDGVTGRGNGGQAGNRKTITFDTVIRVEAGTVLTLTGQADGEALRIDQIALTAAEPVNLAPEAPVLEGTLVAENAPGAVIGTLSSVDPDGDAVTFSTDDARFVIEGTTLRLADGVALDHEAEETVSVVVTATDATGLSQSATLAIDVADVNEAPRLAEGAALPALELGAGTGGSVDLAAALGATDPDGDAVLYGARLAGGAPLPAGLTVENGILTVAGDVARGSYEIEVFATDGELESESVSFTVEIGDAPDFEPITIQAEDGTLTLLDDGSNTNVTVVRDPDNLESNPALSNGLRPDFTGDGYLDFGDTAGDSMAFSVSVPSAGIYEFAIRYASNSDRPLSFTVNGEAQTLPFAATGTNVAGPTEGFNNWDVQTVSVALQAGENTFSLAIPAGATTGPNIDAITITRPQTDTSADADDQPLFLSGPDTDLNETQAASINFNLAGIDADIVRTEISFDGGITRQEVFPDADGDLVVDGSALAPGSYTAIAYVTDAAGNVASTTMSIVIAEAEVESPAAFTIQGEDATRVFVDDTGLPTDGAFTRVVDAENPDAFGNFRAGAVGNAYMDFGSNPGDAITFTIEAPRAGTYEVAFRYANGGTANRPLELSVNGDDGALLDFAPGPVVGTGTTANGWESWVVQKVEVTLEAGVNQIRLEMPAGATGGPNIDEATFTYLEEDTSEPTPFSVTIEAETFVVADQGTADTVARSAANPEPRDLPRDADGNGIWDGATGTGYLDMGSQVGDAARFTVDVPEAGTYTLAIRYSNGGGGANGDRPMTLSGAGETLTVSFPGTGVEGWDNWQVVEVEVDLVAGSNTLTLANTLASGPNLDNVTISRGDPDAETRDIVRFEEVVKINFEPAEDQGFQGLPAGYATPAGYLADTGAAFGDRGNGFSYGWVSEASVADGTANGTTPQAQPANAHWYKGTVSDASDLQKTYAHFEYPGAQGDISRAWEMALENGTYQVTLSVGDTAGAFDSLYAINVEGQNFMPDWVPANSIDGALEGGFRSTLVTGMVTVEDGRLTIDSIGGQNTEIQYLEIERVPDITPDDGQSADQNYSRFVAPVAATNDGQVSIALGADGALPTGIDPTASFVIGVELTGGDQRGPNVAYVDNVVLVNTLTGEEVAIDVQVSGGADSLTIRPLADLDENTSYTLKIRDVVDLGSVTDPNAPLRQMQDLTTTFVTGETPEDVAREVAFDTATLLDGFADGAFGYTSIEFGPDGKLYVATIMGDVHRWDVNADGSIDRTSQETLSLDYLNEDGGRRGIIGFVFDPEDANTIWITDNAPIPRESKSFDIAEFSGRISKITLGENGDFGTATAEAFASGLPRSGGDHLTNSLEFRANPAAGQTGEPAYLLYLTQGSNSAGGSPDAAWGLRPERLLNAAVLEVDRTKEPPAGGFDLRTEPLVDDNPISTSPADEFNEDGTYPGFYNPYADDAPVKIFATGVRNAYDLVWHSNGNLYLPTNGTASGAKTPQDPDQADFDTTITNSPKQYDYFFTATEGGYYGHPNPLRDEWILNGGNPTDGADPNEVVGGNDGNRNTDGYAPGVQPDEAYDVEGIYNLGYNRSPNGVTEYTGNAFGSNLKGAVLFVQFSVGDNVRVINVDETGAITGDDVLRRPDGSVIDNYIDPLDIIENPVTGQLYLMTLNRGTGASQLILLTPAPGGVTQDLSADETGDLALLAFDVSDPSAAIFEVTGLDDDITALRVSFDGGPATTVTLDAENRFTIDLSDLEGEIRAVLEVTDDALNTAAAATDFTLGEAPQADYLSLLTIQAEDRTPGDGTAVLLPTSPEAQIVIRDASNLETTSGLEYGLRAGAFGVDGNTDNSDGVLGGYADFGSTNADFLTFAFDVSPENAGDAILRFRYANGGTADRPLQVEVNGTIVTLAPFAPTGTGEAAWSTWQIVEVPATLAGGANTVTLRAISNTGPNIDQLEILVPPATEEPEAPDADGTEIVNGVVYDIYEAENAALDGALTIADPRNQSGEFVDFVGTADQSITWDVTVGTAGSYALDILYALGAGKAARPMSLTINGVAAGTLDFAANSNTGENVWGPQSAVVTLAAGTNTITVTAPDGNGPNVDYLRVSRSTVTEFVADPAEIDGSGRIELEATDGSAQTLSGSEVAFHFTVSETGPYRIATAANPGAPDGQGLTWFLNGEQVDATGFPGSGEAAAEAIVLTLEAGTEYVLRAVSDAPGASALDYLDISPAPGNPDADIAIQSGDPSYFDNRLHFSYIENPDPNPNDTISARDMKETGTVRISNTGTEPLDIADVLLTGPFRITSGTLEGRSIAPGAFLDVTVAFDRAAYTPPTGTNAQIDATSTVFKGQLRIQTNDAEDPIADIDLAGFWQRIPEGGQEPNVNEVWEVFGFGNRIEGLSLRGGGENSTLDTRDVFAQTDETEVLSPYWRLADGVTQARITQIAAYHGPSGADIALHNPGNKGSAFTLSNHQGTDNQRILPNNANGSGFATGTFDAARIPDGWQGDDVFGIRMAGLSTDPRLNPAGPIVVEGAQQGHTVKMFQALDAEGRVIPNVYLGVMDYTGINYDYNDNMFVIEGVAPAGFGQSVAISGLDDAAADDRLVFTSIDQPANATQEFRDEAVVTIGNDGFVPLAISDVILGDTANYEIVGNIPASIPAGGSIALTVRFIGTHAGTTAGAELITSTLTIVTDDPETPNSVIQLAGIAQEFSERNSEPDVALIVEAFGYSTDMALAELANGGRVEAVGDEVLMPYLQKLDPLADIEVIQIAAFLNQGNVARLGVHGLGSSATTGLMAGDDQQGQTLLPDGLVFGPGDTGGVARGTITGTEPFGLRVTVDGRPTYASWTDPEINRIDPDFGQLVDDAAGHLIRFFQARDASGAVIAGTYIAIQDYPGAGNYDYNDHMFVITNVAPHALTAEEDADGDGVNDALVADVDADGTIDFFDPDVAPDTPEDPEPPQSPDGFVLGVNFGGGAITDDPVLGVDLIAQTDPRVTVTGSVNPAQGVDARSDPNGQGTVAGSAFRTYEDGSDWTAAIEVPNGTYRVVLYTYEPYWNVAGRRQFDATVNGQQVLTDFDAFAEAGGDTPIAVEVVVTVTNGTIEIDLVADLDNAPLSAVTVHEYAPDTGGDGQTPHLGEPFQIGSAAITIDASDYDEGGQGVAYNDMPGLQGGDTGGRPGSDVEQTSAGHIGWINNGEWLEYTVDVAQAGLYDLDFLAAFGGSGARSISASFAKDGLVYEETGPVGVDPTGGWATFAPTDSVQVALEAGVQVMRVTFSGGSQDLASISLTPSFSAMAASTFATSVQPMPEATAEYDLADTDPALLDDDADGGLGHVFGHDLIS
ncbi:carbohydrate binding protein with CBM6 domain [Palleronia aestuarii]|uniref:Carbohydrate binding protein with CBM6 domain n=1 Tax=Palleronia aestuarii TaxID=568105 RepID=A0A2W7N8C3_9RHOB|nr:carbohydrate-binding protein [Palleronia aestuarii]PZX13104.1 carbohydrate binding protein with CBM6 domain [Palleronia aestuarii]